MRSNEDLKSFMAGLLPYAEINEGKQYVELTIPADKWHETALKLRDNEDIPFDYLISLTAVDFVTKFTVVYHVESTRTHDLVVVKTDIAERNNPHVDTVSDVWVTAEYHEREAFDMFGIKFNNHPDLRRLFLEDDYGYPLRKDFKDDINIIELPN